jgi:S1-C subfamily serine protease
LLISIYERVAPSVVFIQTEAILGSVFGQQTQSGSGSGFIIDRDGHIVTNNHVIEGATRIEVRLSDKTTVSATVVGADPPNDLAVLKIDVPADKLQPVELSSSANLKVGQLAVAIGNPLGLEQSMSAGIVSALGRQIERSAMEQSLYDVIQTDAAINPGNSGGPLLDSQGKVIGVNSAIANLTGGSIGIGFAVPVDTVKKIVPVLIQKGRYPHPWLGLTGYALTAGFADLLKLSTNRGVLVMDLDSGGPADRAGVHGPNRQVVIRNMRIPVGGDIIVAVDGNPVENMDQLLHYLDTQKQIGEEVTLSVVRDGAKLDVKVRLDELPG